VAVFRIALSGEEDVTAVLHEEGTSSYLYDVDGDGRILHQETGVLRPPDLVLDGTRLTSLNDELLAELEEPQLRAFTATAEDGLETDVWALTPPGQGPWPAVLYVHGGPYGSFGSTYMLDFQLLVGAGFAVVFNNFRGSGGYGNEFSAKIVRAWGPAGSLDHHAALDAAIAAGIADADRLGVCGLSHGGFATCWLVGTSDRFKAAVAENQVLNRASSFGVADMPWYVRAEMGGPPWERPDVYAEQSPYTYATSCTTPLLFIVGELDMRCYATESEQYFRVLKTNGVPTRLLRLPDSSHGGTIYGPVPARLAQNDALIDWFRRYLA
jgi:dipeptidyl aminopeptidase/acylaminoacyl peptidase